MGSANRNIYATLILVAALVRSAMPLNPIHEATYNLVPRGKFASRATFSVAGAVDSRSDGVWKIPFSLTLEPAARLELGAGLKTQWGNGPGDHIPYADLGARYLVSGATTLQADLLLGVNGGGSGLFLGLHHREGHGERLFSRLTARLGFLDALAGESGLLAMEGAWYPTLSVARPLSLEMGIIASSQTSDFNGNFALDLKPALQIHMGRERMVETGIYVGLAGHHREDLRVQVTMLYGF